MIQNERMRDRLSAFARRVWWFTISLTILCASAACQTTEVLSTVSPIPVVTTERAPLQIVTAPAPRALFDLSPTPVFPEPSAVSPSLIAPPTSSPRPELNLPVNARLSEVIGTSANGAALTAYRFGSGDHVLMLVGGLHGGWESNTVELMHALMSHFETTPEDILQDVTIIIIPLANPDGFAFGRMERGRFNANGVDLNRNWSCEWSRQAYWRRERVNPGINAFSEPETLALANYILAVRPAAVLFYHSAANGVFPGGCGGDHGSLAMAAAYAESAGYNCCAAFSAYPVSGTAATWADGENIPAADVELTQSEDPEFERNLRAVRALQQWVINQNEG